MEQTHELCGGCGKPFTKKRDQQKYCKPSCRKRVWRQDRLFINVADLPPELRRQIAVFLASKKQPTPR